MERNYIRVKDFLSINSNSLICQKNPVFKGELMGLSNTKFDIYRDGCAVVTLYNALYINGYCRSFRDFLENLSSNDALNVWGDINWEKFNRLNLCLRFLWMQDNEISNCDNVDNELLKKSAQEPALYPVVKLQSIYGVDRRHFMLVIDADSNNLSCLESSNPSGLISIRQILYSEVIGARYLCVADALDQWKHIFGRG